jgi:tetratricopeptide (TPR) repeat protein
MLINPMKSARMRFFCTLLLLTTCHAHAQTFAEVGRMAMQNGDYKNAVVQFEKALATSLKVLKEEDLEVVVRHAELGDAYRATGRWDDAIKQLDYAWKRARHDAETKHRWLGQEGDMAVEYAEKLARACQGASRYKDAVMVFSYTIQDGVKSGRDETELLQPCALLADTLLLLGRDAEADQFVEQAAQIAERRHANNAAVRVTVFAGLAKIYEQHRLFPKAKSYAERALNVALSRVEPDEVEIATVQTRLGGILVRLGDADAAWNVLDEARDTLTKKHLNDVERLIPLNQNLTEVMLLQKKPDHALIYAQEALRLCRQRYTSTDPGVAKSLGLLAACYAAAKDYDKARKNYKEALGISDRVLGLDHPQTVELRAALERLGRK